MSKSASFTNPLEANSSFAAIRKISIALLLQSIEREVGDIAQHMKIKNHRGDLSMTGITETLYREVLNNIICPTTDAGNNITENVDKIATIDFLFTKIIKPEILANSKKAAKLLMYFIYCYENKIKDKARNLLLSAGMDQNNFIVYHLLTSAFILEKLPELLHEYYLIEKNIMESSQEIKDKMIAVIKTTNLFDNDFTRERAILPFKKPHSHSLESTKLISQCYHTRDVKMKVCTLKFIYDHDLSAHYYEDILKHIDDLKAILVPSKENSSVYDKRKMIYDIMLKLYIKDNRYEKFIVKCINKMLCTENSIRGLSDIINIYQVMGRDQYRPKVLGAYIKVAKKHEIFYWVEDTINKELEKTSEAGKIKFFQKVVSTSVDSQFVLEATSQLCKLMSPKIICDFFSTEKIRLQNFSVVANFIVCCRYSNNHAKENGIKISKVDLDKMVAAIWSRVSFLRDIDVQMDIIHLYIKNADESCGEACIFKLENIAKIYTINPEKPISLLLTISFTYKNLADQVHESLDRILQKHSTIFDDCILNMLKKSLMTNIALSIPICNYLADCNNSWARDILESSLKEERIQENTVARCVHALTTMVKSGNHYALELILQYNFLAKPSTIPESLISIYKTCEHQSIKDSIQTASLSRFQTAIKANTAGSSSICMMEEYNLVSLCFQDYTQEEKYYFFNILKTMPFANTVNGAMNNVLKQVVTLLEADYRDEFLDVIHSMIQDCQSFHISGSDYNKRRKTKELKYLLDILNTLLIKYI